MLLLEARAKCHLCKSWQDYKAATSVASVSLPVELGLRIQTVCEGLSAVRSFRASICKRGRRTSPSPSCCLLCSCQSAWDYRCARCAQWDSQRPVTKTGLFCSSQPIVSHTSPLHLTSPVKN